MPKISVIVPVYNVENVLHYCVDSILAQTFSGFELILVNDGSTDGSGSVCDEYAKKDSRIKAIHIENQGVSVARNTGIKNANGEYFIFIDSDDYIEENYLEELINVKNDNLDADNIWCGFRTVDGYDNPKTMQRVLFDDEQAMSVLSTKQIMTIHEKWLDSGPVCKLYSRKIIADNNIEFPQDLSLGEDLIFNFEYLDCTNGIIVMLNKCMYNYVNISNESLHNKFYYDMFDFYKRINEVMYKYITKWNCDKVQIGKYHNSCLFMYVFVLKNTFNKNSTIRNKYKLNRQIMKSDEFRLALNNSDCFIHPLYKLGYKHASYKLIRFLDFLLTIKSR